MFNGIIENMGQVVRVKKYKKMNMLFIKVKDKGFKKRIGKGSSISVNGVCLSVEQMKDNILTFSVIAETLKRTNLGYLKEGDYVNIEKPLTLSDFISGHIMLGHIDCTGIIKEIINIAESQKELWINVPQRFKKLLVYKGSIGVEGISLTISGVKNNSFKVSLIPITLEKTNLQYKKVDELVNIEFDYIVKIVKRHLIDDGAGG
ncbi:MAG: riboflavin synthase [Planctomycetota bacterium]